MGQRRDLWRHLSYLVSIKVEDSERGAKRKHRGEGRQTVFRANEHAQLFHIKQHTFIRNSLHALGHKVDNPDAVLPLCQVLASALFNQLVQFAVLSFVVDHYKHIKIIKHNKLFVFLVQISCSSSSISPTVAIFFFTFL